MREGSRMPFARPLMSKHSGTQEFDAMFLSEIDLQSLTGYKRPGDQRRWLASHGWAFEIRADGKNVVLHEEARARMLTAPGRKAGSSNRGRSAEPDLESLRRLG